MVTRGYLTGVLTWTLLGQGFLYYLLRELPLTDWMTILHVCSTVALTLWVTLLDSRTLSAFQRPGRRPLIQWFFYLSGTVVVTGLLGQLVGLGNVVRALLLAGLW